MAYTPTLPGIKAHYHGGVLGITEETGVHFVVLRFAPSTWTPSKSDNI